MGTPLHDSVAISMGRKFSPSPALQVFLIFLGLTALIWVLRGLSVLAFLPGIVLWVLLLLTVGSGIVATLQRIR